MDPRLEKHLERFGYPTFKARQRNARRAARAYAKSIAVAVERESGRPDLVDKNGALNCAQLRRAAGVAGPPNQ
jgi:hypothetical protein